jgi:REP-associated tyrosine transposase
VPRPKRVHIPNAVYHVTQRSTDREALFVDDDDFGTFCELLDLAATRAPWKLHAFCLMTNHVHLLIQTPQPTLPRGMQFLIGEYVEGFNERHGRRGALVQGRYKSLLVETEDHYIECLRYIAWNPVRAGLCARPEHWPWSSWRGSSLAPTSEELLRGELGITLA